MYEENTAQMLQKYANDEDESEDYVEGSGMQYNYLYNSPFDAAKDRETLVQHIVIYLLFRKVYLRVRRGNQSIS